MKTGFAQFILIFMHTVLRMTLTVFFLMIKVEELFTLFAASVLLKSDHSAFSHLGMKLGSLMSTNTVKHAFAFLLQTVLKHKILPIE
jgi:hypothetical protein